MTNPTSETFGHLDKADAEQRIREKAYQLWRMDGAPEGKAELYWHLARELIDAETSPGSSAAAP